MFRRIPLPAAFAATGLLAVGVASALVAQDTTPTAADRQPAADRATDTRPFTLVATGDLLIHDSVIRQARADASGKGYQFRDMLAGVRPLISKADLGICHMETIYGSDDGPYTGYPLFVTPPQLARSVKATGYDSCSTASNHTLDDGADGVTRTLRAMRRAGLKHAGSASSAGQSPVAWLKAGGAKVAQLAYTYGTNGIEVPANKSWLVNLTNPKRIIADARAARRAGADVVVVSMHWGTEYQQEPDDRQRALAQRLTASRDSGRPDIDLIIGTHAHVPQPYEKVNGTWVVYGMGDQLAGVMNDPRGQLSSAARFTFSPPATKNGRWTVSKAEYIPLKVDNDPIRVVNLPRALAQHPDHDDYTTAQRAIRRAVLARGAAKDGLTMGR